MDAVCTRAQQLNDAALPQQALSLIEDLRGNTASDAPPPAAPQDSPEASCASQRNEALQRIALAQQLADQVPLARSIDSARAVLAEARAASSPSTEPTSSPSAADPISDATEELAIAQEALMEQPCAVPEPETSPLGPAYLKASLACDSENETAVALNAPDSQTGPQKRAESWDATYKSVIEPQVNRTIATLVILLFILTLARLLTRWVDFTGRLVIVDRVSRRTKLLTGSALVGISAFVGTAAWGLWSTDSYWPIGTISAALLGLLGAFLLAWAWSQGRSVAVTVLDAQGKEDPTASGHVAALLYDLGASPPTGLEVAQGTDTTALETAGLTTTPEGRIAALAYRLAQLLAPTSPWHVRVEVASNDVHTVTATRNGRVVRRDLVDREQLHLQAEESAEGAPQRAPDLLRMDAAAALMALNDGMVLDGLAGATDWRSVGWHYLATTDLSRTPASVALLARAVMTDPENLLAQQALWNYRYRESADPAQLKAYLAWLEGFIGRCIDPAKGFPRTGLEPLVLRAMVSRVAVAVNLTYLDDNGDPVADFATAEAKRTELRAAEHQAALTTLRSRVASSSVASARVFAQGMERRVKILGWSATRPAGVLAPEHAALHTEVKTPFEAYQAACYFASDACIAPGSSAGADQQATWSKAAITHLRHANAVPGLAQWRTKDPQLAWLRARRDYSAAFPTPPTTKTPRQPRPIIRASSTRS